ncbi:hypothetical protein EMPS_08020 [Entomortierella parvispora]|uniref:Arrestin-like N-terminal domain-containing protein n=1 Tax=Entomortierella parvispora TaxID=205924 RepID=A0A9P3HG34_9FUNG|nr:hypothetical protein EMPS_08020 [Entomortierella parvispora]
MASTEQKTKSLVLSIHTPSTGPFGLPLITGTAEAPAVIRGTVNFASSYDCKGDDITIHFTAQAQVKWSKKRGNTTYNYHGRHMFQERSFQVQLTHPKVGTVAAGNYTSSFEIPIHPDTPCSSKGTYGWMTYKIKAILVRSFPSLNMVHEQKIWVMTSLLPKPQRPLIDSPLTMSRFNGTFLNRVPYICVIPSEVLYLGQQVPVTFKCSGVSNTHLQIVSANIKLKQYTTLTVKTDRKIDSRDILNLRVDDGWPHATNGQAKVDHASQQPECWNQGAQSGDAHHHDCTKTHDRPFPIL